MFNTKLKQEIAALKLANQQLQEQYNLVHVLLQARQDDCVTLQRELAAVQPVQPTVNHLEVKEVVFTSLKHAISEKLDFLTEETTDAFFDFFVDDFINDLLDLFSSEDD